MRSSNIERKGSKNRRRTSGFGKFTIVAFRSSSRSRSQDRYLFCRLDGSEGGETESRGWSLIFVAVCFCRCVNYSSSLTVVTHASDRSRSGTSREDLKSPHPHSWMVVGVGWPHNGSTSVSLYRKVFYSKLTWDHYGTAILVEETETLYTTLALGERKIFVDAPYPHRKLPLPLPSSPLPWEPQQQQQGRQRQRRQRKHRGSQDTL